MADHAEHCRLLMCRLGIRAHARRRSLVERCGRAPVGPRCAGRGANRRLDGRGSTGPGHRNAGGVAYGSSWNPRSGGTRRETRKERSTHSSAASSAPATATHSSKGSQAPSSRPSPARTRSSPRSSPPCSRWSFTEAEAAHAHSTRPRGRRRAQRPAHFPERRDLLLSWLSERGASSSSPARRIYSTLRTLQGWPTPSRRFSRGTRLPGSRLRPDLRYRRPANSATAPTTSTSTSVS